MGAGDPSSVPRVVTKQAPLPPGPQGGLRGTGQCSRVVEPPGVCCTGGLAQSPSARGSGSRAVAEPLILPL